MNSYCDRIFKIGKIEKRIYEKLESDGFVYFVLVDPEKPGDLVSLSKIAQESGVTAIMVGGSTAQLSLDYEEVISKIKHESSIPVIIFPSGTASIARGADAIWFMSLLNSDDLFYVIG
ncbi:MAG: geranylgeranylglyceryl/heptaprenylglyceryl phosphate synthase, partial [Thermoproteota archaeon]